MFSPKNITIHIDSQQYDVARLSEVIPPAFDTDESLISPSLGEHEHDTIPRTNFAAIIYGSAPSPSTMSSTFELIGPDHPASYPTHSGMLVRGSSNDGQSCPQNPVTDDRVAKTKVETGPSDETKQESPELLTSKNGSETANLKTDQSTQTLGSRISPKYGFPENHEDMSEGAIVLKATTQFPAAWQPLDYTAEGSIYDDDSLSSQSDDETFMSDELLLACENPPGPNDDSDLGSFLDALEPTLARKLMGKAWATLNEKWKPMQTVCVGEASSYPHALPEQEASVHKKQSFNGVGRVANRQWQENNDENLSDDENGKAPKRPNLGQLPQDKYVQSLQLSCPFRKRDPRKYSLETYQSCALGHWDSVGRVKEHIYRRHRAPVHCTRCWMQFENNVLLKSHSRMEERGEERCKVMPEQVPDGITTEAEKLLKIRKKEYKDQSEPELWKRIYRIIFPNEIVPSPFFEPIRDEISDDLDVENRARYDAYYRRELPLLIWSRLELVANIRLQYLKSVLQVDLDNVIQECIEQLSRNYEKLIAVPTSIPEPVPAEQEEHQESPRDENILGDHSALSQLFSNFDMPLETAFSKSMRDADVLRTSTEAWPPAPPHSMDMSWSQGPNSAPACYCPTTGDCTHGRQRPETSHALPLKEIPFSLPLKMRGDDMVIDNGGGNGIALRDDLDEDAHEVGWTDWSCSHY